MRFFRIGDLGEITMNILLVDDSKTMRNIQKKVLAALGEVKFSEAADGLEAL